MRATELVKQFKAEMGLMPLDAGAPSNRKPLDRAKKGRSLT